MKKANKKIVRRRIIVYITVFVGLILFYVWKFNSPWVGNMQLHTIMELTATLLAFFVGIFALRHYYIKREAMFLFIGAAFLGTAFLDGYHTVISSIFFNQLFTSVPQSLLHWSWNSSRYFLSITMLVSGFWGIARKKYGSKWELFPATVYISVGTYTLASFLFFAFYPLPQAFSFGFFKHPQEYGAGLFFLAALAGYLYKGGWRENIFEHWLVLSLIVGFIGQVLFMPFSSQVFDFRFDGAHLLKNLSYIFVLIGLLYLHLELLETKFTKIKKALLQLKKTISF